MAAGEYETEREVVQSAGSKREEADGGDVPAHASRLEPAGSKLECGETDTDEIQTARAEKERARADKAKAKTMRVDRTFYYVPTATVYLLLVNDDGYAHWHWSTRKTVTSSNGVNFSHYDVSWSSESFPMGVGRIQTGTTKKTKTRFRPRGTWCRLRTKLRKDVHDRARLPHN